MNKGLWRLVVLIWLWGVGTLSADDTEILGVQSVQVQPNVLIIFDTSGSMAIEDIPAEPYDRAIDYGNGSGYERDAVYRWQNGTHIDGWVKVADWIALDPTCRNAGVAEELSANGLAWGRMKTVPPHDCDMGYGELDLRMGNYLNYENRMNTSPMRSRLDAAKEVVKQLFDDHPTVRFGLMHFAEQKAGMTNDTEGGRISEHGDINDHPTVEQLKADVDAFSAATFTPLAEALAEAGLYFAGQKSWFNNLTYTSPIDIKCRPNFIILMTDGESTRDQDSRLGQNNGYINNGTIGDYDGDGNEFRAYDEGGTDYLDDVAAYLYENDLMPQMGIGDPRYEKQNIITHTIGFKHAHRLLRETAENGGGRYFTTGSTSGLSRAFDKIFSVIENTRHVYVAPSVPVSRINGVYAGSYLYMAMFKPDLSSGQWRGNLKKYKLDPIGRLLDRNSRPAVDSDHVFLNSAQSFWSEVVDGTQVDLGGAGALLIEHPSRKLYTYIEGSDKNLTASVNAFSIANKDNIPLAELGVASDEQRQAVIKDIHGIGKEWVMGDVIHSKPTVGHYDTNGDNQVDADDDALIFVGTNGGVMHAFWDSSGQEYWGFIPPHQLGRLKRLSDDNAIHDYFLDGAPVIVEHETDGLMRKTLVFGERRGGSTYSVIDITSHDEPFWKYAIGDGILGEGAEKLGQSWGRPQAATIASGSTGESLVLLLPGGYDTNQDAQVPIVEDQKGRAVFSVELESGQLGRFKFMNDGVETDMTHCIVDIVGIDPDGDGITDSIYAPDLGGNMFAFRDSGADGTWQKLRLFNASNGDTHRKIFYSPDVVRIMGDPLPDDDVPEMKVGEMIYFGTGDRAHPNETKVKNRFYAIKNFWWDEEKFTTMTDDDGAGADGDLYDATQNLIVQGAAEERSRAADQIKNKMGWFIDLKAAGEKVVSSPVVYNGTVYFTTFVPQERREAETDAACNATADGTGVARLYGVDYEDGRAVHDTWSNIVEYNPETGEEIKSGGKADRYLEIGQSMPSAPMIAIRDGVAILYVGVDGRLVAIEPNNAIEMNMYYWREIKP